MTTPTPIQPRRATLVASFNCFARLRTVSNDVLEPHPRYFYDKWGQTRAVHAELTAPPEVDSSGLVGLAQPPYPERIGAFLHFLEASSQQEANIAPRKACNEIASFLEWNEDWGWDSGSWTGGAFLSRAKESDRTVFIFDDLEKWPSKNGRFLTVMPPLIRAFSDHWKKQRLIAYEDRHLCIRQAEKFVGHEERILTRFLTRLRAHLSHSKTRQAHKDWHQAIDRAKNSWRQQYEKWSNFFWQINVSYLILSKPQEYRNSDFSTFHELRGWLGQLIDHLRKSGLTANIGYFSLIDWSPALGFHIHFVLIRSLPGGCRQIQKFWQEITNKGGNTCLSPFSPCKSYLNLDIQVAHRLVEDVNLHLLTPLSYASRLFRISNLEQKQKLFTKGDLRRYVNIKGNPPSTSRIRFGNATRTKMRTERNWSAGERAPFSIGSMPFEDHLLQIKTWGATLLKKPKDLAYITAKDIKNPSRTIGSEYLRLADQTLEVSTPSWLTLHPIVRIFRNEVRTRKINRNEDAEIQASLHQQCIFNIRRKIKSALWAEEARRKIIYKNILRHLEEGRRQSIAILNFDLHLKFPDISFTSAPKEYKKNLTRELNRLLLQLQKIGVTRAAWTISSMQCDGWVSAHLVAMTVNTNESPAEKVLILASQIWNENWITGHSKLVDCNAIELNFEFRGRAPNHSEPLSRKTRCAAAYLAWGDDLWWITPEGNAPRVVTWPRRY